MTSRARLPLLLGLCLPTILACTATDDVGNDDSSTIGSTEAGETGEGDGDSGVSSEGEPGDGDSGDGDPSGDGGDGDGEPGDGDGDTGDGDAGDGDGDSDSGDEGDGDGGIEPGQLTAGEWRDLDNWDFWLGLGDQDSGWLHEFDAWGFDTRVRVPVLALADGLPVADTEVTLRDSEDQIVWTARTDNEGHAELWPELLDPSSNWPMTVEAGELSIEIAQASEYEQVVLELPEVNPVTDLDLMFMVDTTGSMSDELSYLQVELGDVISRVEDEVGGDFGLRLSVNFYRDDGDEYVVRSFPFTTDVSLALSQLSGQEAAGGGDWPEAVDEALEDAVFGHDWSPDARSRLVFLILDAPPHDEPYIRESLEVSIRGAAELGIRVIPVAASGIDKETEFLLRHIDIATGATYTFLTDHSGIGGGHLEPTVGEYTVELFNDLLVRLIVESMV